MPPHSKAVSKLYSYAYLYCCHTYHNIHACAGTYTTCIPMLVPTHKVHMPVPYFMLIQLQSPACNVGPAGSQAAEASASSMNTAFSALTESLNGQRQQLEAYASQQHAASSAMLQHTQSAIALARQHLHDAGGATTTCQQNVDHTLSAQSSALSAFDQSFASSMQEEQVRDA